MPTYIDKDKLMNEFIEFVAPSNRDSSLPIPTWNDAVSLLGSAPDADVVEVIRCKDCKHYFIGNCMNTDVPIYADNGAEFMPDSDFYCSYGERRESE